MWTRQDPVIVQEKLPEMCLAFRFKCIDLDVSNLITSTSNPLYFLSWKKWITASYLLFHIPFCLKSLVAQIRLNARKFYFKGSSLQLGGDYCLFCDCITEMNVEHVLLRCRIFETGRVKCSLLLSPSLSHLLAAIGSADECTIKSLCYYVIRVLKFDLPSQI